MRRILHALNHTRCDRRSLLHYITSSLVVLVTTIAIRRAQLIVLIYRTRPTPLSVRFGESV